MIIHSTPTIFTTKTFNENTLKIYLSKGMLREPDIWLDSQNLMVLCQLVGPVRLAWPDRIQQGVQLTIMKIQLYQLNTDM